jgi:hypothetical protein
MPRPTKPASLLTATLSETGGKLTNLVTMTVYILDARYGDNFIKIRKKYFKTFAASVLLTVSDFALPDMTVEIQGIAVINDGKIYFLDLIVTRLGIFTFLTSSPAVVSQNN